MPVIIAMLWGALARVAGSIALQVLIALGIGFVTYKGADIGLNLFKDTVVSNINSLPTEVVGILGTLKVGTCINMVFSTLVVKMGMNGMQSGTFKKWVLR